MMFRSTFIFTVLSMFIFLNATSVLGNVIRSPNDASSKETFDDALSNLDITKSMVEVYAMENVGR